MENLIWSGFGVGQYRAIRWVDSARSSTVTRQDVELAATECRELWGLGRGALADIMLAAEGAGVVVAREVTGIPQIEGLSAWSESLGRPIVFLSADKDNGYRSRFDLAHEIGHLVLHRHIEPSKDREHHKQMEKQAHYFAGALLLPAETFAQEIRTPISLDDLLLLKRRWGVSVGAIIMRLKALEVIDAEEHLSLMKRRSARWGMKAEPGDQDRTPERPRLLRRTIDLLAESGVLPFDGVARHVGVSALDIEGLAGLPEGYLSRTPNVIQFARLKPQDPKARPPAESGVVVPLR